VIFRKISGLCCFVVTPLNRECRRLFRALYYQQSTSTDVRFASKADVAARLNKFRFTPESGHQPDIAPCPLCARSRHSSVRFVIFIPSDADYDGRRADWIFERKKLKPRGDYV
jgi:hypothetical protein